MTNSHDEVLQTRESEASPIFSGVPFLSAESQNAPDSSVAQTIPRPSGTEVWRAVLTACQQIPKSLQHTFVVQVLISILDDPEIPIRSLHEALRRGFESVQRVEETRQCRS